MRVRRAAEADVNAIVALKASLRFDGDATSGFLLGCDAATYRAHVAARSVWVLDAGGAVAGVAVVQRDDAFRASDVWGRRSAVRWDGVEPDALERLRIAYFDQLGVARGRHATRKWAPVLAIAALNDALVDHDVVFATTVVSPVRNEAAVPYLRRAGGRVIGRVDEVYPGFGPLVSDVWALDAVATRARLADPVGRAEAWWVSAALLDDRHRQ